MEIEFTHTAREHLNEWKRSGNKVVMKKIENLLESIEKDPFTGLGKPEILKYNWAGFWSRRINREHRLVYNVDDEVITVYSLKGHYK